jgi:type IV secretory pathway TraG/TraD family ATPase VirD4
LFNPDRGFIEDLDKAIGLATLANTIQLNSQDVAIALINLKGVGIDFNDDLTKIETAEHLSKLTGQTTVVKEQVTTSGRGWSTNVSRSTHEVSRPLLTPDEAMRMKGARKNAQGMITEPGNIVIYVAGYPAIMGLQPLYFRDSELDRRARYR